MPNPAAARAGQSPKDEIAQLGRQVFSASLTELHGSSALSEPHPTMHIGLVTRYSPERCRYVTIMITITVRITILSFFVLVKH